MKKRYYTTLFLSLFFSASALSAEADTPDNYAYGAELIIEDSDSMFSRINLNNDIYLQSVSPQLNDVRIFNRNGQTVPFALVNIYEEAPKSQSVNMILYPIGKDNTQVDGDEVARSYDVAIQGKNINISIEQPNSSSAKYVSTYLLQIPNNDNINQPITNLVFSFTAQPDSWQATADISYSADLRYWNKVISSVPLMTLMNDSEQTLTLNDVSFPAYAAYKNKNWLITLYSQKPIPNLIGVTASSQSPSKENALVAIDLTKDSADNNMIIYSLPAPVPIKMLSIELFNDRTILPVTIYYKSNQHNEKWVKFTDRIIRKTDAQDTATEVAFNDQLVQQIKLEAINSSFENAPKLIAYRNKVNLVFNSANNAPFILAWGSANVSKAALDESILLTENESVASLPQAGIGQSVKLGGESALLKETTPDASSFPRWVIWLGLIIGAVILVLLALKLLKEIKNNS